jgi:hypothetical protein
MKTADQFHVDKLEFLDRSHLTYDLRPKSPLEMSFGFYSPDITLCYPGGEGPLNTPPHGIRFQFGSLRVIRWTLRVGLGL